MSFTAKYNGACGACGGRIEADVTEVTWARATGVMHVVCPEEGVVGAGGEGLEVVGGVCGDCFSELPRSGVCGVCA